MKITFTEKILLVLLEQFIAILLPAVLFAFFVLMYAPFNMNQGVGLLGTSVLSYIFNVVICFFYNVFAINKRNLRLLVLVISIFIMIVSYLVPAFIVVWTPDRSDEMYH